MPILKMQRSIEAKGISLAIQGIPRHVPSFAKAPEAVAADS
jgi:hypothetical protein